MGVRDKLALYSLNLEHEDGAAKARGFAVMLGITLEHIDHLEAEISSGVLDTPISSVRDNAPYGISCVVELSVRGKATSATGLSTCGPCGSWRTRTRRRDS
jgi:hypothetical protein